MPPTDPEALFALAVRVERASIHPLDDEAADAIRAYAELVAAISYCAWDANACARWDGCDSAEDIVRVAKDCGWPGLGKK